MTSADWPAVEAIFAEGIATRNATFETETPAKAEFDVGRLSDHRLVALVDGVIVGWAALSPTSGRCCYSGVAEHSVYVSSEARGRGVGRALLKALLASARRRRVDDPDERLPRERGERRAAPASRLPRRRAPRADRSA